MTRARNVNNRGEKGEPQPVASDWGFSSGRKERREGDGLRLGDGFTETNFHYLVLKRKGGDKEVRK